MPHTSGLDFLRKSHERQSSEERVVFSKVAHQRRIQWPFKVKRKGQEDSLEFLQESREVGGETVYGGHQMAGLGIAKFLLMRTFGNFLILLSVYAVLATFGPALYYEVQYQIIKVRGIRYSASALTPGRFESITEAQQFSNPSLSDVLSGAKTQILVPPDPAFSIVIPKLGATARIWPNVDPLNEMEFLPKLQKGVAHARGSVFPGMQGNVYLFAHSTDNFWDVGRYNAVFYMLKDMQAGDDISVYFENKRYNYKVDRSLIKDPSDVDLLKNSQIPGKQQLILQTCWPPGTTWKRLFIIAKTQTMEGE